VGAGHRPLPTPILALFSHCCHTSVNPPPSSPPYLLHYCHAVQVAARLEAVFEHEEAMEPANEVRVCSST
jgi:hypothetical protein